MELPDSGARKQFASGAVRDISEGKGRMDLMDMECLALLLDNDPIILEIGEFVQDKDPNHLVNAMEIFIAQQWPDTPTAMVELSKHYENGARKYSPNNYKLGIDLHCYIDSALRHYMKFLRGDRDENHERSFLWNLMCGRWTFLHRPEVDDIDESYLNHAPTDDTLH